MNGHFIHTGMERGPEFLPIYLSGQILDHIHIALGLNLGLAALFEEHSLMRRPIDVTTRDFNEDLHYILCLVSLIP
jgi:hypothetical protein